uniref:Uncharacterized protein n=1 Tax=Lotharella oceanica TaxID=641309 RepID=A0A7S2U3C1_9EUKA|mmetsp:Transcript_8153/g.16044  ORF Transcript_8153/g.16044 Transcript_8153/m.16044 type:complete len:138 (+) Transcript_8153:159-572(+)
MRTLFCVRYDYNNNNSNIHIQNNNTNNNNNNKNNNDNNNNNNNNTNFAPSYDYETDVERNSFNILRCYVKKHGKDASLHLAARISDFEKKYDEALKRLDAPLREAHVKREKTAMDESKATTWVFPPLILDEAAHRRQ